MYQAFDTYLAMDTWHTRGVGDDRRFFEALLSVIRNPEFSAEEMADYMRQHESYVADELGQFDRSIERRIMQAEVMRDYLIAMDL